MSARQTGEQLGGPPVQGQETAQASARRRSGKPGTWDARFPGFDAAAQARHWDPVTAGVVLDRLRSPEEPNFFTPAEQAIATALCNQLLGMDDTDDRVPVAVMIDQRLAQTQTDGWHYADMPEDAQAWRDTLRYLDEDAREMFSQNFARCDQATQRALIQTVQDTGSKEWHGLTASHVWSLWTRYACTAFYSHPWVWDEIGFPGPAYPRGYKNTGVGLLEPFEVRDSHPAHDPVHEDG
jgi:hypothetical protein